MKAVWKDDPEVEVEVQEHPTEPTMLITDKGEVVDSADVHIVETEKS